MDMQDYFKVGGPVDQAMRELTNGKARYQCRMEQVKYAEKAYACFEGGSVKPGEPTHVLAIEAETGVGKTNGALIPMLDRLARHMMAGEDKMARGALCTYTTALRRQIVGKDLPIALRAVEIVTGQHIEVAEYWGAQQYVSEEAIRKMSEGPLSSQDKDRMKRILAWWYPKGSVQSAPGEKSVYYGSRLMMEIKHEMGIEEEQPLFSSIDDVELMGKYDEVTAYPEYRDMREQVTAAHFILMSHAAALFNGFRNFSLVGADRPLQYLVVDEAHKIPDAAASIAKRSIALNRVVTLLEQVRGQDGVPGGLLKSALRAVKSLAEKVHKAYPESRSERVERTFAVQR